MSEKKLALSVFYAKSSTTVVKFIFRCIKIDARKPNRHQSDLQFSNPHIVSSYYKCVVLYFKNAPSKL